MDQIFIQTHDTIRPHMPLGASIASLYRNASADLLNSPMIPYGEHILVFVYIKIHLLFINSERCRRRRLRLRCHCWEHSFGSRPLVAHRINQSASHLPSPAADSAPLSAAPSDFNSEKS